FRDGSLVVTSPLLELSSPGAAFALLLISGAAQQIAIFDMVGRATDNLVKAERRNFALAFRLRELLPGGSS
ncbi:MAG: hypothetical protein JNK04_15035, partial [Myxococcales bacterium]|nr:hypothetical protein [Myxococcales bacterium]